MQTAKTRQNTSDRPQERVELERRYGEIGISALVAALRYQGSAKNSTSTRGSPARPRIADATK